MKSQLAKREIILICFASYKQLILANTCFVFKRLLNGITETSLAYCIWISLQIQIKNLICSCIKIWMYDNSKPENNKCAIE